MLKIMKTQESAKERETKDQKENDDVDTMVYKTHVSRPTVIQTSTRSPLGHRGHHGGTIIEYWGSYEEIQREYLGSATAEHTRHATQGV
jgi:hypothetical protein